jgi:hypothetical protein
VFPTYFAGGVVFVPTRPSRPKAKEKLSREEDEVLIDRRLQIQPRARQKTRELSGERALLFGKHGCSRR